MPKNFVSLIKSKPAEDGLVAINTDGNLYDGTGEIREYRYSGLDVNNYVFFDTNADGIKTDDEIWRIVGVFKDPIKDSNGEIVLDSNNNPTYEEKIKLVKNSELNYSELPRYYVINGSEERLREGGAFYWNYADYNYTGNYFTNIWPKAGLQYFLNTEHDETDTSDGSVANLGYLSLFANSSKKLISSSTYYIGAPLAGLSAKASYASERDDENLVNTSLEWKGLVGLLYPSDYGYSANNAYWDISMGHQGYRIAQSDGIIPDETSWMAKTLDELGYYISPSYSDDSNAVIRYVGGYNDADYVSCHDSYCTSSSTLPVIHLIPDANIIDAPGTLEDPYVVVIE